MNSAQKNWLIVVLAVLVVSTAFGTGRVTAQGCPPVKVQIPPCEVDVSVEVEPCICEVDVDVPEPPVYKCPEVEIIPGSYWGEVAEPEAYRLILQAEASPDDMARAGAIWNWRHRVKPTVSVVYDWREDQRQYLGHGEWSGGSRDEWSVFAGVTFGVLAR